MNRHFFLRVIKINTCVHAQHMKILSNFKTILYDFIAGCEWHQITTHACHTHMHMFELCLVHDTSIQIQNNVDVKIIIKRSRK